MVAAGLICADCGGPIGEDDGPPDGWQLEDGRTVCQACCVKDIIEAAAKRLTNKIICKFFGLDPDKPLETQTGDLEP